MSRTEVLSKYIAFGSAAILVVYMAATTVFEKIYGAAWSERWGYSSPVFVALWALTAIAGMIWLFSFFRGRLALGRLATMGIHLAFVVILAGAAVTRFTGDQGSVVLPSDSSAVTAFIDDKGERAELPFSVSLSDFEILYYPGTRAPMDYVSEIEFRPSSGIAKASEHATVSMNRIFRYQGYRFYQMSYASDGSSVTLAVSHDPAGVALTYSGYVLLLLSMIGFFFQKSSGFRSALRRLASGPALAVAMFFLCSFSSSAASANGLKALPESTAASFGELYVYYNDRVAPVQTLARDFTLKLYGSNGYEGFTSEQVLTGWLFYTDSWSRDYERFKAGSREKPVKLQDKENTIFLLCSGSLLKIFPYVSSGSDAPVWYSSSENLPFEMDEGEWFFVRKVLSLAGEKIAFKDFGEAEAIFGKIREYQEKNASAFLPSRQELRAERLYNSLDRPKPAFMLCLTVGFLLFILSCAGALNDRPAKTVNSVSAVFAVAICLWLTLVLGLRWLVSGHVPMANGFETMMSLAWITLVMTVVLWRRLPLLLPMGFIVAGFALLVASSGESDPQITRLMPVLSSPLLSIHVALMMISYSLLGIVMLGGVMALVKSRLHRSSRDAILSASMDLSLAILYPAIFCLVAGTFLGAVWANISWGRYWAWDPKEVWALVTMLVYSFALHGSSLKVFRRPAFFHAYTILAFLCVLITYFGVNFILGGLHAYV